MRKEVGEKKFKEMIDVGKGKGRIMEILEKIYMSGVGIDIKREMIEVERENIDIEEIGNEKVSKGDVYELKVERERLDMVKINKVMNFIEDKIEEISEDERELRKKGRMMVVDFEKKKMELMREENENMRMGLRDEKMMGWMRDEGIENEKKMEMEKKEENGEEGMKVKMWIERDKRIIIEDKV